MSKISDETQLEQILKQRYAIECKCKICKKKFDDILLGQNHIFTKHKNQDINNVIDYLEWDLRLDAQKYKILQELETKRSSFLQQYNDDVKIQDAEIPVRIRVSKSGHLEIKEIVERVLKNPSSELTEEEMDKATKIHRELDKTDKRVIHQIRKVMMSKEVENALNKRKGIIDKYLDDLNHYLGTKKALNIMGVFMDEIKSKGKKK